MSTAIAFDTYVFVKKLKDAGMPEEQARILAETHTELIEERLATKRDLKELETNLQRDIKALATKDDLRDLEFRVTLRFGGMLAASIAVVAALVKLL